MRVLIAFYNINNLGGIINHTENLIAGFKTAGHTVEMAQLHWRDTVSAQRCKDPSMYEQGEILPVRQGMGWLWKKQNRWPYKGKDNKTKWKTYASTFDMVIWQIAVPTKQKDNRGNTDWLDLYDHSAKNIVISHDGNFAKANGHIHYVKKYIHAMACVHPCAFNGAQISIPKAMVLNPQLIKLYEIEKKQQTWIHREPGFLSCQTFKAWKRVHELVAAIPKTRELTKKIIAGGGIEHNYMTSVDKCKPQYMLENGEKIWDVALRNGMEFLGYIENNERDKILRTVRTLVDPSWSKNYAKVGDHFNRVVVDAMIQGCIPVARDLGISMGPSGNGELFYDEENYYMIPHNATQREFAEGLDYINNISQSEASAYHENALKLLPLFNRDFVVQQFIDLLEERGTGIYSHNKELTIAEDDEGIKQKGEKLFNEFFNNGE